MKTKPKELSFFESISKDIARIAKYDNNIKKYYLIFKYIVISKGFRAIIFYRLINKTKNIILLKNLLFVLNVICNNIEISYTATIGPGLLIPHGQCIVIGGSCIIGRNVTIQQGVTIGNNLDKNRDGKMQPIIGNNVLIAAGAKIIGPVTIGDNSIIGANSVVTSDIPMNSIAVGIPANVIKTVTIPYPEQILKE
jgi:serine O-acetyltransferase